MAEVVSEETHHSPASSPGQQSFFRHTQKEIIAHQRRFGLAYLVLAIGVGVAVGLGIVLIGRNSTHHTTVGVKTFHPTASGELAAKQIARHVGYEYRQDNGDPIATVIGERPNYQYNPLLYYLIRPADAQYPNDIGVLPVGNGIMYSMCGTAANCAAETALASPAGATMFKREALELSLETFKTDSAVETVTTLLPTLSQTHLAIVFKRSDLSQWLDEPLSHVLEASSPLKPGQITTAEAARIDKIESGATYQYEPKQGSDGSTLLQLDPVG